MLSVTRLSKTQKIDPGPSTSKAYLSSTSSECETPEGSSRDASLDFSDDMEIMDLEQEPLPKGKAVSDTVLSAVAKKLAEELILKSYLRHQVAMAFQARVLRSQMYKGLLRKLYMKLLKKLEII